MTDRADEIATDIYNRIEEGLDISNAIRAYGEECRQAALEEAEKACHACDSDCAAAIRALKEKP